MALVAPDPRSFYFSDIDALMDLAGAHGLAVTLNTLTDMSPLWLFDAHPRREADHRHGA